jgi:glycosyltransferase involved in cell wall biosynthesis
VQVVPNGVELPPPAADRAAWRSRLGLADDQLAACMIAHLHIFKDHATLLRAWRMVVDRRGNGPPPVLLLAGKPGDTADATGQLVAELQLQRHVRLLGPVDDVAGLLGAADLGVLSSRREGCPNAVLEYMAAGLPVIASDIDGVRMALGPAAAPWLAPTGNAAALAAQIAALLDDAGLRQQLGAANRQRAQIEFSPRQLLVRTLALLTAQLSSAARRAA